MIEQRLAAGKDAFLCQQPALGDQATRRRETHELLVRSHHPMAGHDDRDRIVGEGATDIARQQGIAQLDRDGAIGPRLAPRDRAREVEDTSVEVRQARQIDRDLAEVGILASEQSRNPIDRVSYLGRRLGARLTGDGTQRRRGLVRGFARQPDADDPARAPGDSARTDRGVEQGPMVWHRCGHERI